MIWAWGSLCTGPVLVLRKPLERCGLRNDDAMTAQILALLLYLMGSLCFVAGSAVLLWKALA